MPRLIGKNVVLREFRKDDLPFINSFTTDYEICRNLSDTFLRNHSLESTEKYLNSILENSSNDTLSYVIAEKDTLNYIGQIDIMDIDWIARIGILGIVIAGKDFHNKGIGTEAINLILKYAFERANLNKIELDVNEFNLGGIRCYEKCGFIKEGIIRESLYREGKYYSTIKMGILKREFKG
jgi:RimJ/RimL family protein N-acetyltransferase